MIRRLFVERGGGKDGVILLADLIALIRGGEIGGEEDGKAAEDGGSDDGHDIFDRNQQIGDSDIMMKVNFTLIFQSFELKKSRRHQLL